MRINNPLISRSEPSMGTSASVGPRIRLPIGKFQNPRQVTSQRQMEVLKAVAAAASVREAKNAVIKAKEAKDNFEDVIEPDLDDDKLDELINAVRSVRENPSEAQIPSAEQKAAADAIGANPVLVRAAYDKMKDDELLTNGRRWVAAVDGNLLEGAAREGARRSMLDRVPADQDVPGLEKRIETLGNRLDELIKVCNTSNEKIDGLAAEIKNEVAAEVKKDVEAAKKAMAAEVKKSVAAAKRAGS